MPNTITKYECTICKGVYDTSALATACEGKHPETMQFARAAQSYKAFEVMPDVIMITHDGVAYKYYLK